MKKFIYLIALLVLFACSEDEPVIPVFKPSKIFITSAEVTEWPKLDPTGAGWDLTSAPDVYLTIDDRVTVIYASVITENTTQNTFTFNVAKTIGDLTKEHAIAFWDADDPDDDDVIGAYLFTIEDFKPSKLNPIVNDFPTEINLTTLSNFKVKLNVIWQE